MDRVFQRICWLVSMQLLCYINSNGQSLSPGNVFGPCLWLRVDTSGASVHYKLWDRYSGTDTATGAAPTIAMGSINFHGVPAFVSAEEARWTIGDSLTPPGSTLFMVSKPANNDERVLWAMEVADTGRVVLTSRRSADLSAGMHLVHEPSSHSNARMTAHVHRADTSFVGEVHVRIGTVPTKPVLPSGGFEGVLPEAIFFDRVLGPRERARLSSYLAIKYGLTLVNEDYVTSADRSVWSHRSNKAHAHRMFAVAKDHASMLDQRQGTSAMEEGFLTLGVDTIATWHAQNPARVPDMHYLIAGDDGKPRTWAVRQPGQAQYSSRTWLMQRTGDSLLTTLLRLDPAMMQNDPEVARKYWLVIDRTGTGSFGPGTTEFLPSAINATNGTVDFLDVFWDLDASGTDRFKVAVGGAFIPVTWLEQPICEPPMQGVLTIQVPGGDAPIRASLNGIDHAFTGEWDISAQVPTAISGIGPGEYDLRITDNTGQAITDRIWVQAKDAPKIPLAGSYELIATEQLVLDAEVDGDMVLYEWKLDDRAIGDRSRLVVEKPGTYTCTVTADGCPARAVAEVRTKAIEDSMEIGVMPNPSLNGDVVVQVVLPRAMDAEMMIVSMQGHVLSRRTLKGQDFHRVQEHIPTAGQYIVSVRTSDGQRSARVIVL